LSTLTTEEVSSLMERISGLNPRQLPGYQQAVLDNNINGQVLAQCQLDDLGKCLQMKFGDWQLFKSAIEALRECESCEGVEEEGDGGEGAGGGRQRNEVARSVSRTIQWSGSVESGSGSPPESSLGRKSKKTIKRQSTVDSRETDSTSKFEVIAEEEENTSLPLQEEDSGDGLENKSNMRRNDSMVAEAMYESGLLHKFVHNFTENVSEGDEDEEDGNHVGNDLLLDLNDNSDPPRPTVQFQLSLSEIGRQDSDPAVIPVDESDPLIHTSDRKPLILDSPTPVLRLPRLEQLDSTEEDSIGFQTHSQSDPDLYSSDDRTNDQENSPLLSVSRSASTHSMRSVGFAEIHAQAEPSSPDGSMDLLSVVDETQPRSLQDSIEQFTMHTVGGSPPASSPRHEFRGNSGPQGNNPESFV